MFGVLVHYLLTHHKSDKNLEWVLDKSLIFRDEVSFKVGRYRGRGHSQELKHSPGGELLSHLSARARGNVSGPSGVPQGALGCSLWRRSSHSHPSLRHGEDETQSCVSLQ